MTGIDERKVKRWLLPVFPLRGVLENVEMQLHSGRPAIKQLVV
jgi:hypothetical protein